MESTKQKLQLYYYLGLIEMPVNGYQSAVLGHLTIMSLN